MRLTASLICAFILAAPAAAQRIVAAPARVAPILFSAAPPRLAHPSLLPTGLPGSVMPILASLAAPSLPNPVTPPRAAAALRAPDAPLRLIFMGPPGSGKSTYGKRLAAEYGAVHISVGELLRAYAKDHPEIAADMLKGDLVSSAVVLRLVRERLSQEDVRTKGYILDGFPRRLEEAVALDEWLGGVGVDAVVHLEVSQEELLRRIGERGRADDTPEAFAKRMMIYRGETVPVLERLRRSASVLEPDVSSPDPEVNYRRLREILDGALKGSS